MKTNANKILASLRRSIAALFGRRGYGRDIATLDAVFQQAIEEAYDAHGATMESVYYRVVRNCFEGKLGNRDHEVHEYVARLLSEFSHVGNLYQIQDANGELILELEEMVAASDPVNGVARSFDEERAMRKHIGDHALYVAGMYLDEDAQLEGEQAGVEELVATGKESYRIVSLFDLFEYAEDAPLFARLSTQFDEIVHGLKLVREELQQQKVDMQTASETGE